jgi:hypothetical protein
MKLTPVKVGLFGIAISSLLTIVHDVVEIRDARAGKKRLHPEDVKLIADRVTKGIIDNQK